MLLEILRLIPVLKDNTKEEARCQLGGLVGSKIGITGAEGAVFALDFLFMRIGFAVSDFAIVFGGSFQPAVNSKVP